MLANLIPAQQAKIWALIMFRYSLPVAAELFETDACYALDASFAAGWEMLMRARTVPLFAAMIGTLACASGAYAQSRSLPKGSSLAATPPIDQRGKQFHALSRAQQLRYLHQGYKPHHHPY